MIVSGRRSALAQCAVLVIGLLLVCAILDTALAQPFGVPRGAAQPEIGGFAGWILQKQAEFYRMHPPLGPTLFFLRGVAPPQITTRHIYVGIIPFVLIQLLALVVLWFVPGLATALPHALYSH